MPFGSGAEFGIVDADIDRGIESLQVEGRPQAGEAGADHDEASLVAAFKRGCRIAWMGREPIAGGFDGSSFGRHAPALWPLLIEALN